MITQKLELMAEAVKSFKPPSPIFGVAKHENEVRFSIRLLHILVHFVLSDPTEGRIKCFQKFLENLVALLEHIHLCV